MNPSQSTADRGERQPCAHGLPGDCALCDRVYDGAEQCQSCGVASRKLRLVAVFFDGVLMCAACAASQEAENSNTSTADRGERRAALTGEALS